ncbi:TnsD family Tn7-like transposition protein [Anoxybacillus sp. PDR2]|uniref:TnsD family Tn7-like transposition protein n=1 Tax=Anoxybacillaceae TaxID=3120669 RepID=UPI001318AC43|nr:TnsD family Tn7-like transposition protein [Anoxybacillus sp. PDR2]QHC02737.1 transposase [Anoxybacillus sp. PDR2]
MLSYFPTLYNDELLYSWFARYHIHSSNISPKQTMKDLYGKTNIVAVPDLPTNLNVVYEKLRHFQVPDVAQWIKKHTLFRYYTTFATSEIKHKVYRAMESGEHSGAIHMMTGIMANAIKEWTYFRFCPRCFQEDIETIGESYWRVSHQLPGVYICLKHNQYLCDSSVPFRGKNKHEFIAASPSNCMRLGIKTAFSERTERFFRILAEQSVKLIQGDSHFTWEGIQSSYRYLLQRHGYATINGKVNQQLLAEQFTLFYGEQFLETMQSSVDILSESCWLKSITRKHRKSFHPIRHLLLIYFLGEEIDTFYQYAHKEYKPFGEGPYFCLNPAAKHYKQRVIPNVKTTICTDTRRPVGTFECTCGFIYSRRGPDKSEQDLYKIGRIKQYGQVWLDKLHRMIHVEKLSYYAAAKELQCDITTVIKYANKGKPIITDNKLDEFELVKSKKQKEWIKLLKQHPNKSVTQIRSMEPALYAWLYRHDREWLKNHSPKQPNRQSSHLKINWAERDEEVLKEVKLVIKKLKSADKPIYINKSRIGKEIRKLSLLEKHLDKLPKTKEYILQQIETREQFQIRRVRWACHYLFSKNESVMEWKVKRLAGLKGNVAEKVQQAINDEIIKYQQIRVEGDIGGKNQTMAL